MTLAFSSEVYYLKMSVHCMLKDPFGDVIKKIMDEIHTHADLLPLCEPGTQTYEQWAVQKEQNGEKNPIYCILERLF